MVLVFCAMLSQGVYFVAANHITCTAFWAVITYDWNRSPILFLCNSIIQESRMHTQLDVIEHTSMPSCSHDDYDYTLPLPYVRMLLKQLTND